LQNNELIAPVLSTPIAFAAAAVHFNRQAQSTASRTERRGFKVP
jgi:hypothetical protein